MITIITLIEILAALLLPAVNDFLKSSQRDQPQNNIRQIVTAYFQYRSDNNDWNLPLPISKNPSSDAVNVLKSLISST